MASIGSIGFASVHGLAGPTNIEGRVVAVGSGGVTLAVDKSLEESLDRAVENSGLLFVRLPLHGVASRPPVGWACSVTAPSELEALQAYYSGKLQVPASESEEMVSAAEDNRLDRLEQSMARLTALIARQTEDGNQAASSSQPPLAASRPVASNASSGKAADPMLQGLSALLGAEAMPIPEVAEESEGSGSESEDWLLPGSQNKQGAKARRRASSQPVPRRRAEPAAAEAAAVAEAAPPGADVNLLIQMQIVKTLQDLSQQKGKNHGGSSSDASGSGELGEDS